MERPQENGARVRLKSRADLYPHGIVPEGAEGTVTNLQPSSNDITGHVTLDEHFEFLAAWENDLQVHDNPGMGVIWDDFEAVEPKPHP